MFTSGARRGRGGTLAAGALALAVGAAGLLVAAAPAQADTTVESGTLNWGFKQSFRNYVGNQTAAMPPLGAAPIAERIVVTAPATFDPVTPVIPTTAEETKRPYAFPVTTGAVNSATDLTISAAGGVTYNFPSHYFTIQVSNPTVKVVGSTATIYADTVYNATQDFGSFTAGYYTQTQAPIGTSSDVTVNVTEDSATVSLANVTLTAEGHSAVPLYNAGDPLDNLTVTVALEDEDTTPTPTPQISLSKTVVDPAGETITVTGTGFVPTDDPAALSTRQPITVGDFAGFYVVVGKFLDDWKPSEGAASSTRKAGSQKWAITAPIPSAIAGQAVVLNPDGSFTAELNVSEAWGTGGNAVDASTPGNYGIYTYGASGSKYAGYETYTPITFQAVTPEPTDDQQTIVATIPGSTTPGEPSGEFTWTIQGSGPVDLGEAVNKGAYLESTGSLLPVVITDTRANQVNAWSVNGQIADFIDGAKTFDGKYLGWTPKVIASGAGAVAGPAVVSGWDGGTGLKASSLLASAVDGHDEGSATVGADLVLKVPAETAEGTYTALLTLTAIG